MRKYKELNGSTEIQGIECIEGESIEDKIRRITENNEPLTDGTQIIYTPRKDGVQEQYNVRTDRWEIALNAMDKVSSTEIAKRNNYLKIADSESIQGDQIA